MSQVVERERERRAGALAAWARTQAVGVGGPHLQLGDPVGELRAHALPLSELDLQLLQLGLHLLALVLRVRFAQLQHLHLVGQLPSLILQGLLGLLEVGFHLWGQKAKT